MSEQTDMIRALVERKAEELAGLKKRAERLQDEIDTLRKTLAILGQEEKADKGKKLQDRYEDFGAFIDFVVREQHTSISGLASVIGLSEASIRNWMQKSSSPQTKSKALIANQISILTDSGIRAPEIMEAMNVWFPKEAS